MRPLYVNSSWGCTVYSVNIQIQSPELLDWTEYRQTHTHTQTQKDQPKKFKQ